MVSSTSSRPALAGSASRRRCAAIAGLRRLHSTTPPSSRLRDRAECTGRSSSGPSSRSAAPRGDRGVEKHPRVPSPEPASARTAPTAHQKRLASRMRRAERSGSARAPGNGHRRGLADAARRRRAPADRRARASWSAAHADTHSVLSRRPRLHRSREGRRRAPSRSPRRAAPFRRGPAARATPTGAARRRVAAARPRGSAAPARSPPRAPPRGRRARETPYRFTPAADGERRHLGALDGRRPVDRPQRRPAGRRAAGHRRAVQRSKGGVGGRLGDERCTTTCR